jgi:hypothetical protein
VDIGVPTFTLIGTLGNRGEACQIYPAVYTQSAPLFALPSPFDSALPATYWRDARYYLIIENDDGANAPYNDTALIARVRVQGLGTEARTG